MSSLCRVMESNTCRVIILLLLLFGLSLFLVEYNQICPRHEISYFQMLYKEEDYTSKHFSDEQFDIIYDRYSRLLHETKEVSSQTDDVVWNMWWKEWSQTTTGFEINGKHLCLSDEKKFVICTVNEFYNYACIDALSGAVDICGSSISKLYPLPLCKEEGSKKLITCGDNTNLCWPARCQRKTDFPIRPCSDKERHLCLIGDGSIDTCSKIDEDGDSATDVNWNIFWREWQTLKNEVTKEISGFETASLCLNNENKIVICEPHMSKSELCVGAESGEVGICKEMNETSHLVPLCLTTSTKEIVTCGNFTVANLCFISSGNLKPLRPCMSISRRTCLTDDGLLGNCSDVVGKLPVLSTPKTTVTVKDSTEVGIAIDNQQNGLMQLCRNDIDDKVHVCEENSTLFAACLSIVDGSIETCNEIESKSEFGIPVCVQENTSNLVTCGKFSHSNLCMEDGVENFQLKHCKTPARFACVTGEGSLKFCSSLSKHSKKRNFSNENLKYALPMKYDTFELKLRSVTYLCKPNEENHLVQCLDDANLQAVCLNLKDGKIISCKSIGYHNLSLPVCIMGSNKYIVTCGKFNLAPVCLSAKNESSKYIACVNTRNMACLNSGAVETCSGNIILSQGIKGHPISTRSAPKQITRLPMNSTNFRHKEEVYQAVMKSFSSIMKNFEILCMKKGKEDSYSTCMEEKSLEFACLSPADGKLKNCKALSEIELGVTLCVKKSREIITCGKFSQSPLCMYEILDDRMLTGCVENGAKRACLTKEGLLEPCTSVGNSTDNFDKENESEENKKQRDEIIKAVDKIVNASHKRNIILCVKNGTSHRLINCDDDPSLNFACLGAVEGSIKNCSSYKSDFPISVCARTGSYHFVTCDIPSNEHLCNSKIQMTTYSFPCESPDQHSCVTNEGLLGKCTEQGEPIEMKSNMEDEEDNKEDGGIYEEEDSTTDDKIPALYEDTVGTRGPNDPTEEGNGDHTPSKMEYMADDQSDESLSKMKMANMDASASSRDPDSITHPEDDSLKISTSEDTPASESTDEKFFRIYCSNCTIDHKFVIVGTPDDVLPEVEVRTFPTEE